MKYAFLYKLFLYKHIFVALCRMTWDLSSAKKPGHFVKPDTQEPTISEGIPCVQCPSARVLFAASFSRGITCAAISVIFFRR